jgi:hypothetical protein
VQWAYVKQETEAYVKQVDVEALSRLLKGKGTNLTFPGGGSSYWDGDGHSLSALLFFFWALT